MSYYAETGSRLCDHRVEEFRAEFGMVLADRIIEAEAVDFLWEARVAERYLGQHHDTGWMEAEREREISRVAVLSWLAGSWSVGLCLVDGEGTAVELVWKQAFDSVREAESMFAKAH